MTKRSRRSRSTLEMEIDGLAPAGVLTGEDGSELAFAGWAELASAIERWRAASRASWPTRDGETAAAESEHR